MSIDLSDNLVGLAIGLRYRKHFAIEAFVGMMVDAVLYSPKSFFNADFFPNVEFPSPLGRRLANRETGNSLLIDPSDIIMEIGFGPDFNTSNRSMVLERYHNDILKQVVAETPLSSFERIGIIHKYEVDKKTLDSQFPIGGADALHQDAHEVTARFAKRLTMPKEARDKHRLDYANAIVQIRRDTKEEVVKLTVDYQWYFLPPKDKVSDVKYLDLIKAMDTYISTEIGPWLDSHQGGSNG